MQQNGWLNIIVPKQVHTTPKLSDATQSMFGQMLSFGSEIKIKVRKLATENWEHLSNKN